MLFTASGGIAFPYTLNYTTFSALSLEFWINIAASWQYIVATCDGTTTIVYLNNAVTSTVSAASIEIGALFDFAGSYQAGYLDEIALYNYVLTPSQINVHYVVAMTPVGRGATTLGRDGIAALPSHDGVTKIPARNGITAVSCRNGIAISHTRDGITALPSTSRITASLCRNGVIASHVRDGIVSSQSRDGKTTTTTHDGITKAETP